MTQIEYDPQAIHERANQLYEDADHIVRNFVLLGACTGFSLGVALSPSLVWPVIVVSVFGTGFGYVVGLDRARTMRIDAQMALLHSAVERNTRAWLAESRLTLRGLGDAVDRVNRALELGVVAPRPATAAPVAPPPVARRTERPVQAGNAPPDDRSAARDDASEDDEPAPAEVIAAATETPAEPAPRLDAIDPREFDDSGFYDAYGEMPVEPTADEERA